MFYNPCVVPGLIEAICEEQSMSWLHIRIVDAPLTVPHDLIQKDAKIFINADNIKAIEIHRNNRLTIMLDSETIIADLLMEYGALPMYHSS